MMPHRQYRCYFTDANDRIRAVKVVACDDDAEAMLRSEQLLASSEHRTAELWQGARLVGKWGKARAGANAGADVARPIAEQLS